MAAIVVNTYSSRTEAEVARAYLESGGIEAAVVTDSASGLEPQLEMIRGVKLLVAPDVADEARQLLDLGPLEPIEDSGGPRWVVATALVAVGIAAVGVAMLLARIF